MTTTTDDSLTSATIRAALEPVTYRPGWKFHYEPEGHGGWGGMSGYLTIHATVEDTYHPGQMIKIVHGTPMPPFWDETDLLRWVAHWLQDNVERHESREWFKVNGVMFDDPHKGGR